MKIASFMLVVDLLQPPSFIWVWDRQCEQAHIGRIVTTCETNILKLLNQSLKFCYLSQNNKEFILESSYSFFNFRLG